MKTLQIHKAQQTLPDVEVPSVSVVIDEEIQDYTLKEAQLKYRLDAAYLCDFLHDALPGGTFDKLLIAMLERKASHFKVTHSKGE